MWKIITSILLAPFLVIGFFWAVEKYIIYIFNVITDSSLELVSFMAFILTLLVTILVTAILVEDYRLNKW